MTQNDILIMAFKDGQTLTVAKALTEYGIYALSQRCGELKRKGFPIKTQRIKTASGKMIASYSL
jgi:hypothetical protein